MGLFEGGPILGVRVRVQDPSGNFVLVYEHEGTDWSTIELRRWYKPGGSLIEVLQEVRSSVGSRPLWKLLLDPLELGL